MRLFSTLLAVLALALAGPCLAAAAKAPPPIRLRPAPAAQPAKPAQSKITPLAGQMVPPLSFAGAPGLKALGLESMRLGLADAGPACQSTCASNRYVCGVDDESCVADWRQCVLSCGASKP